MSGTFFITCGENRYRYNCKEDYEKDIADGTLDGKIDGKSIIHNFSMSVIGVILESITLATSPDVELTEEEVSFLTNLDTNKSKLNVLEGEYSRQETTVKNFEAKTSSFEADIETIKTENKENSNLLKEKQEELKNAEKKLAQYQEEQENEHQKELNRAIFKAELEYNPDKHGQDKNAYIQEQTKHLTSKPIEISSGLAQKIATLKLEASSLETKIENNNKRANLTKEVSKKYNSVINQKKDALANTSASIATVQIATSASEAVEAKINDAIVQDKEKEE